MHKRVVLHIYYFMNNLGGWVSVPNEKFIPRYGTTINCIMQHQLADSMWFQHLKRSTTLMKLPFEGTSLIFFRCPWRLVTHWLLKAWAYLAASGRQRLQLVPIWKIKKDFAHLIIFLPTVQWHIQWHIKLHIQRNTQWHIQLHIQLHIQWHIHWHMHWHIQWHMEWHT